MHPSPRTVFVGDRAPSAPTARSRREKSMFRSAYHLVSASITYCHFLSVLFHPTRRGPTPDVPSDKLLQSRPARKCASKRQQTTAVFQKAASAASVIAPRQLSTVNCRPVPPSVTYCHFLSVCLRPSRLQPADHKTNCRNSPDQPAPHGNPVPQVTFDDDRLTQLSLPRRLARSSDKLPQFPGTPERVGQTNHKPNKR